ncbi:ATP-binding cassette domain-containing protein [Actinomyces sp.]|uniref:ATP-binding cassette domain-containing protein n=1 Tax=Actinomyces sp. TaxID=29317 RepID=UPI0026DB630F|nr:ATP-binding cassette domain-containing protein [Actinomyces sp.]MDO4899833.1 ATP-binding cassette domain-containing protein [Actinomyces sp.]
MLEVIDVQRRYRGGRGTGPLTLEVAAGEVLGVVGPNGAGKTTLFGALCGVSDFQSGTVRLDGRELGRRLPAEACGFLPEQSRLFPQLTARQACRFEAAMRRWTWTTLRWRGSWTASAAPTSATPRYGTCPRE